MLLWLSAETPDVNGGGGQRRQYHQISSLVASQLEVTVATVESPQDDTAIRSLVCVERFSNRPFRRRGKSVGHLIEAIAPERAVVSHVETAPDVVPQLRNANVPFMIDFHNVNSRWYAATGNNRAASEWRSRERDALTAATRATSCSGEERTALIALNTRTPIDIAPNGIDPREWPANALQEQREPSLVFFGSWEHAPNRIAAAWLVEEVWPYVRSALPESRLLLFGPGQPPEAVVACEGVAAFGRTPSLAAALGRVAVSVVPIRKGIGARVKFIESLASGAAVVSTSAGSEGFDVEGAYVRANTPEAFVEACIRLLRDRARAAHLGRRGRDAAFSRYTWRQVSEPMLRFAGRSNGASNRPARDPPHGS